MKRNIRKNVTYTIAVRHLPESVFVLFLFGLSLFGQPVVSGSESEVLKFYSGQVQTNVKERHMTIQVGDSTKASYTPSINVDLWQGECKFRVNLANGMTPFIGSVTPVVIGSDNNTHISLSENNISYKMYKRTDNNFEWEIIFSVIPDTNVFTFNIETQGLDFFYQSPLTNEDIKNGCYRPDSVVGSYAVYHSTKKNNRRVVVNNDITYESYMTGKAFHIYRPKAWDSSGDTIWVDIFIDTLLNQLALTVDSVWLRNAAYPVTIDPTFGYTTGGASEVTVSNFACEIAYNRVDTTGAGTVDTGYIYVREMISALNPDSGGVAYYNYNTTLSNCNLQASTIWEFVSASGTRWISHSINGSLGADTGYVCAFQLYGSTANNLRYKYDSGTSYPKRKGGKSAMGFDSSLSGYSGAPAQRKLSVYFVYTESGTKLARRRNILLSQKEE